MSTTTNNPTAPTHLHNNPTDSLRLLQAKAGRGDGQGQGLSVSGKMSPAQMEARRAEIEEKVAAARMAGTGAGRGGALLPGEEKNDAQQDAREFTRSTLL